MSELSPFRRKREIWSLRRRGAVSRHEGVLQPEVSTLNTQRSRPIGRLYFFLPPAPDQGFPPRRAQRGEERDLRKAKPPRSGGFVAVTVALYILQNG